MNKKIIRQSVGIDCSKDELVVAFGMMLEDFEEKILSNERFRNTQGGFKKLLQWGKKLGSKDIDVVYVIEATGVYHESVSLFLYNAGQKITVMLPNKVNAFSKTLKIKTVNDKVAAQAIAMMGLEKKLDPWQPPHEVYSKIKQLTRERDQLNVELTQNKNQLHAEESGAWPNEGSIKRVRQRIRFLDKQCLEVEQEIEELIDGHLWLKKKIKNLCTIKGIGYITAAIIVGEADGFNLIRNKKQLVSYAGLDIVERESGTSVRGKTRISHKGNKYIRKSLHFPALAAIRSTDTMKALFVRLVGKHGIKMKAVVAVQRKLLELVYVLWKNDTVFDPEYSRNKESSSLQTALTN